MPEGTGDAWTGCQRRSPNNEAGTRETVRCEQPDPNHAPYDCNASDSTGHLITWPAPRKRKAKGVTR